MQESDRTVQNVLDRGSVLSAKSAVHVNQRPKPMAILYLLGGLGVLFALFYTLLKSTTASPVLPTGTPTLVPTRAATSVSVVVGLVTAQPVVLPSATALPNTPTPAPTMTPAPTATALPDVWLSVASVAWPKKGWGAARTLSGLVPASVDGWGLACPKVLTLGTRLELVGGRVLTCVDQARGLDCLGGICKVLLFQSGPGLAAGLYPARLVPPKSWEANR